MRGKRQVVANVFGCGGLIPAYAGKTAFQVCSFQWCWAHPRVCGENIVAIPVLDFKKGSSPRMRGKPSVSVFGLTNERLIPAYAGKTRHPIRNGLGVSAHPRVCGENSATNLVTSADQGSSPRMRGKRIPEHTGDGTRGLIPAYAGKTVKWWVAFLGVGAHPRVCGENPIAHMAPTASLGSSPRMRGKRLTASHLPRKVGLIPAYAGKTP